MKGVKHRGIVAEYLLLYIPMYTRVTYFVGVNRSENKISSIKILKDLNCPPAPVPFNNLPVNLTYACP